MARRARYTKYRDTLHLGINQQPELVVDGEVADARNVWAIDGRLETRPGYEGCLSLFQYDTGITLSPATKRHVTEIGGVLTTYGGAWSDTFASGDRIYIGLASSLLAGCVAIRTGIAKTDYTDVGVSPPLPHALLEYWNGTSWRPLRYAWVGSASTSGVAPAQLAGFHVGDHLTWRGQKPASLSTIGVTIPSDIALLTVDATAAWWVRFTILGASKTISGDGVSIRATRVGNEPLVTFAHGVSSSYGRGVYVGRDRGEKSWHVHRMSSPYGGGEGWSATDSVPYDTDRRSAPSYAFVPETRTLYVGLGGSLLELPFALSRLDADEYQFAAKAEDSETIVGEKAPYSRDYITQALNAPTTSRVKWTGSRLWSAHNSRLRWSAPYPNHRVWPSFNVAYVGEDDPSDITALSVLGEQLVIFKRESIYIATAAGQTAFGTQQYQITRVVSGVGCIAENSIQKVRGRLVFLGEDGVYVFDGTPNIRKATLGRPVRDLAPGDRLIQFMRQLNWGHANQSVSANMRAWHCYVCAVPFGESQRNDHLLVWDYDHNAWWIWDNIEAQHIIDGDTFGHPSTLFFVDYAGRMFALGQGTLDNYAAITSSVTTKEIALKRFQRARLREVELLCDSATKSVSIDIRRHEDDVNMQSGVADFSDPIEPSWSGTLVDGETQWAQGGRRYARVGFRVDGDQFNVKLTHTEKGQRFKLSSMDVSLLPYQVRR